MKEWSLKIFIARRNKFFLKELGIGIGIYIS